MAAKPLRLRTEHRTIKVMIGMYCHDHHKPSDEFCQECGALFDYATKRIDHCPWGAEKPACSQCTIHCYEQSRRAKIIQIMRYSGPRMLFRHPFYAIAHLLTKQRAGAGREPLRKSR